MSLISYSYYFNACLNVSIDTFVLTSKILLSAKFNSNLRIVISRWNIQGKANRRKYHSIKKESHAAFRVRFQQDQTKSGLWDNGSGLSGYRFKGRI